MGLAVIGAGWGRTGTKSLKLAVEHLGLGPCHHMEDILASPRQLKLWLAVANGETVDWNEVFAGYRSAVDWPSAHYWRELAAFYPDARVILTVRPAEAWWNSYSKTLMRAFQKSEAGIDNPHMRGVSEMVLKSSRKTFPARMDDKEALLAAYRDHEGTVRKAFAGEPERLLVYDVKEGWEPLCRFLGVPVPMAEFPHSNTAEDFWADKVRDSLK
ncbi:MAG: sulfotransferase family protein [Gammaproteobacteria bacterium]|nr:MAG: sulfotransferase family protein [Gammaproteobacteria bacterium]